MHKWRSLRKSWALYSRITTPRSANMELVASLLGWSLGVSGVKGLEERENERLQVNITLQWPASQPHGWILSSAAKYFKPIFTNRGYSCTWNISLSGPLMRSDSGPLEALAAMSSHLLPWQLWWHQPPPLLHTLPHASAWETHRQVHFREVLSVCPSSGTRLGQA